MIQKIFDYFNTRAKVQEMTVQNHKLADRVESLNSQMNILVGKVQEYQEDLNTQSSTYRGNSYAEYSAAVTEIDKKYKGTATWGVAMTGNLIDVMAAFILGHGIGFSGQDAETELAFLNELFDYNDFNDEGLVRLIIDSLKEGKLLLDLTPDEKHQWTYTPEGGKPISKTGMIKIRFRPWRKYSYTVSTNPTDYLDNVKVTWEGNSSEVAKGSLNADQFVYRKFGGNIYEPNEATPKMMRCLTEIEDYDKCKRDWREINHLFASPTPDFQLDTMDQVAEFTKHLEKKNWRIGKFIAHVGKFSMVSASMEGVNSLERERLALQKTISGCTGVPVHFYDPEVMSNKRLGENEMEFVWASFNMERKIIQSAIDELINKAMAMQTAMTNDALDSRKITSTIKIFTDGDWQRLQSTFIPMREKKMISEDTLLARIPGLDVEAEKKLLSAERDEEAQKVDDEATKALNELKSGAYKAPFNSPDNFNEGVKNGDNITKRLNQD
jgi:hypothetical protein